MMLFTVPVVSESTPLGIGGGGEPIPFSQSSGFATKKDFSDLNAQANPESSSQGLLVGTSDKLLLPTTGIYTQFFHWGHKGVDIANPSMPTVFAAKGGVVIGAYTSGWNTGYGKYVLIDHGNGMTTRYAHLSKVLVQKGQTVVAGAPIGDMGSTGRSSGNHLHFEVLIDGVRQNPLSFI